MVTMYFNIGLSCKGENNMKLTKRLIALLFSIIILGFFVSCAQDETVASSETLVSTPAVETAPGSATYSFSADIVKSEERLGVNAEWNDRVLVLVILDHDHSKTYTSGDEILYLNQLDLLAQKEAYRSKISLPADVLSGRQITSESGELIMLIGGKYSLTEDSSAAAESAGVVPMSYGATEPENVVDISLYDKSDAHQSAAIMETANPVFSSGSVELAGIPEAGSEIACSVPVPEGVSEDQIHLLLVQYDNQDNMISCSTGTADSTQITAGGTLSGSAASVKAIVTDDNLLPLTSAQLLTGTNGGIRLESQPSGAEVWIDGEFKNVTPCMVSMPAGEYNVQLKIKGYKDSAETAVVVAKGLVSTPSFARLSPDLPTGLAEDTITVSGIDDVVDGDTSSIAALQSDPGRDGKISLREAVNAANATQNGRLRTIQFAPELMNSTITLNLRNDRLEYDLRQSPLVLFDNILINGDIDGDAIPDITISAPETGASAFFCWSSNITFASLRFKDCHRAVSLCPAVAHTLDYQLAKNIENISIVNCDLQQNEDEQRSEAAAIQIIGIWTFVQNEKKVMLNADGTTTRLTAKSDCSGFSVSGVTISGNDISYEIGIWIMGTGAMNDQNNDGVVFRDFNICANRINLPNTSGNAISAVHMLATDCNNAYDGPPLDDPSKYIYSDDCSLENILFRGNTVIANNARGMLLGSGNMGNSGNTIKNLKIDFNRFESHDTGFACIEGQVYNGNQYYNARVGERNRFENLTISHNVFQSYDAGPAINISASAVSSDPNEPPAQNNWLTNLTIENNDIQIISSQGTPSGIRITAGQNFNEDQFTNSSYVDGLMMKNNRISYIGCFQESWDKDPQKNLQVSYGAITLFGGETGIYNNHLTTTAIADGNYLKSVVIEGNVVKGAAISLFIVGGFGNNATNNSVEAILRNNVFSGEILSFENAMNATGNHVVLTEQ